MRKKVTSILLPVIVFAALVLRFYPITAELPHTYWHDENNYIETAMRFGSGSFLMPTYSHGGFFQLVLFVLYGAYFAVLRLAGIAGSPAAFLLGYLRDPSVFFIIARAISALCGTAIVFLAYAVPARIFNRAAALVSAVFTAFSLIMVQMSLFALADMLAVFLMALGFLLLVLSVGKPEERKSYYGACVLFGLSIACKYYTVFTVVPLYAAAFIKHMDCRRKPATASLIWALVSGSLLVATGFFIGIPSAIFNLGAVYQDSFIRLGNLHIAMNPHKYKWLYYFTTHMVNGLRWPLELAALAGMAYAVYKRSKWDVLLVSFPVAQYLLFMNTTGFAYHMIPSLFFMFILAGRFLADVLERARLKDVLPAAAVLGLVIVYPSFADSVKLIGVVRSPDTRTIAKAWIEDNIKPGARILEEGCLFGVPIHSPCIAGDMETIKRDLSKTIASGGGGFLQKVKMSHFGELYGRSRLYDIVRVDKLTVGDLLSERSEYVIVTGNNDTVIGDELRYFIGEEYFEKRRALRDILSARYKLERSFAPTEEFTPFFPHLMNRDYQVIRKIGFNELKGFVKGPRIDIYKAK